MKNHHLHQSIGGGKESSHDDLEELLALLLLVIWGKLDVELLKDGWDLVLLEVHDGIKDLENGVQDELVEGTLQLLALMFANLGPLLGLRVEVVVTLYLISAVFG